MFEILYKDPATIGRYRRAALLEARERYLCAVVASGVVGDVARRVARAQLALMELLNLPDADIPLGLATVETAVQEWCRNLPAVSAANFRRHAFRWLRFLGWLEEPVRDAHPHTRQVGGFRGLDARRSGTVGSDHQQLLLPERPSLCLGSRQEPDTRRHDDR